MYGLVCVDCLSEGNKLEHEGCQTYAVSTSGGPASLLSDGKTPRNVTSPQLPQYWVSLVHPKQHSS